MLRANTRDSSIKYLEKPQMQITERQALATSLSGHGSAKCDDFRCCDSKPNRDTDYMASSSPLDAPRNPKYYRAYHPAWGTISFKREFTRRGHANSVRTCV